MAERITVSVDEALADLIPDFLQRRRDEIRALGASLGAGDFDAIRITGHSLKGTGGGYGFDGLTDIGAALETAALAADAAAIEDGIEMLADYLARVDVVFD